MKKIALLLLSCLSFSFVKAQLPEVDLAMTLAHPPANNTFVVPLGDTLEIYLKITNNGPGDLDTTDNVWYSMSEIPPNYYLAATDSGTMGNKVKLEPGQHYIASGITFMNDGTWADGDTTMYVCFYFRHEGPAGTPFYTDNNTTNDTVCLFVKALNDSTTSIAKSPKALDFKMYPNPASNELNVHLAKVSAQTLTLVVTNSLGQDQITRTMSKGEQDVKIDLAVLPAGIYQLRIMGEGTYEVQKFVKY